MVGVYKNFNVICRFSMDHKRTVTANGRSKCISFSQHPGMEGIKNVELITIGKNKFVGFITININGFDRIDIPFARKNFLFYF